MSDKKKILVVDDEPDVIRYITIVLVDYGYDTTSVSSAQEALQRLKEYRPDLICLDIMMPKQSGIWLYLELKSDEKMKDIPVIIVSGIKDEREFDFRELVPDSEIPPPQAFIEKPINIKQFLEKIGQLIGR